MDLIQNTPHLWLISGVILIVLEFMLFSGIGFLFAGLGALLVGALLETHIIQNDSAPWIIFLVSAIIFGMLLWRPLSRLKLAKPDKEFSDMVGHKATLISDIAPGEMGKVRWSGTIMNAKLDAKELYSLPEGALVVIKDVIGNTLVVAAE